MRFASLGSGSRGNATLIESASARLLVDCGFSVKETEQRLHRLGVDPASVDAVLLTHEHSDHLRGASAFARRYKALLAGTQGSLRGVRLPERYMMISPHGGPLQIEDFAVQPYPVPHDSREPVQYTLSAGGQCLGMLTDAGSVTPHARDCLSQCDALVLECNHDTAMLRDGPYPWRLKQRVAGNQGHLSNDQAAGLVSGLDTARLRYLLAAHLSAQNNRPELVTQALLQADEGLEDRLTVLCQDGVADWYTL